MILEGVVISLSAARIFDDTTFHEHFPFDLSPIVLRRSASDDSMHATPECSRLLIAHATDLLN